MFVESIVATRGRVADILDRQFAFAEFASHHQTIRVSRMDAHEARAKITALVPRDAVAIDASRCGVDSELERNADRTRGSLLLGSFFEPGKQAHSNRNTRRGLFEINRPRIAI